jgi:hypothetical protein
MSMRRTPPLSIEGSREVLEEMSRPPADTPERRRMFEIASRWRPVEGRPDAWEYHPGPDETFALGDLVARKLAPGDLNGGCASTVNEQDASAPSGDLPPEDENS